MPPPTTISRLVLLEDGEQALTTYRETDARSAMSRGLAEYLRGQSIVMPGGAETILANVFDGWASLEEQLKFPSACVYTELPGSYGGQGTEAPLSPEVVLIAPQAFQDQGQGDALLTASELVQTFRIEAWASGPKQRIALACILEDALVSPVDFMTGFVLELPHYFNLRAVFEIPQDSVYEDSEIDAQKKTYRISFQLRGRVRVARAKLYKSIRPATELTVDDVAEPAENANG